jgi:DNA-binding NarL/FixJ family response regulator
VAYLESGGSGLDAVIRITRRTAATEDRALAAVRSPLAASILLFAGILALRLSAATSQRPAILLLLIGPIVVMTLAYSSRAGVGMATAGLAAFLVSQQVDGGTIDAIGVSTRAFAFYAIPLTIWLARKDAERHSAAEPSTSAPKPRPVEQLTRREREVLGLVAAGHTNAEIAQMLVLSVRTVESHRASLRRKLGRPSLAELVLHAQDWGLLSGESTSTTSDGVAMSAQTASGLVY